ncbi:hypothetical protein Taro_008651 [Colocasia esculenta]|uniref:Uncharacterized protein n=1 Tax=Colocasia esculenta TaxID=4460 RepID=A0A843U422_COLES|nr:hypothetical protein [Colocasia esculenta]
MARTPIVSHIHQKLIPSNPFSWLELWRTRRRAGDKGARKRRLEQGGVSQVTTLHTTTGLDWSDERPGVIAMDCP